jgi:16S rRNA (adenine1518-N6/adenine1519-N6)-dimethyltransferase
VDSSMIEALQPKLPRNVTLIHADFLDVDIAMLEIGAPFRVAGNLPYNVSSPILFALLDAHRTHGGITDATLMLQREVANRITADPGSRDYGVLSVFLQLDADVHRVLAPPPGAFRPAPKVHSAVVRLRFRRPAVNIRGYDVFAGMVRAMFTQRRKTIANAVARFASARHCDARAALAAAGIDPRRRPETLQLEELAALAEQFL